MSWQLDHIAVAARTLEEGAAWVEEVVGAPMLPGGRHATMGTHNRLLSLGFGIYLEVIAVDPEAAPPKRTRWFDLDRFSGPPCLRAWVARTGDLDAALQTAPAGTGEPVPVSRGTYRWRISVPADGRLPFDGVSPALIEWQGAAHPADALPPSPVRFVRLDVAHPEPLGDHLPPVEGVRYVSGSPALRAVIQTPAGARELT